MLKTHLRKDLLWNQKINVLYRTGLTVNTQMAQCQTSVVARTVKLKYSPPT